MEMAIPAMAPRLLRRRFGRRAHSVRIFLRFISLYLVATIALVSQRQSVFPHSSIYGLMLVTLLVIEARPARK